MTIHPDARPFDVSRRTLLSLAAALAPTGLVLGNASPTLAQAVTATELAKAGALGDVTVGSADAKVSVIEYASLTCSHCARFHQETYPAFKAKYLDTGKVKFTLREFPLDPLATAGFMVARCNDSAKYYAVVDLLFQQQQNWAFVEKPLASLVNTLKQAGFTQESFEACLKRDDIYVAVNDVKNRAAEKLGVSSTPTFFINGQKHSGALSLDELDKILTPLLGS